MNFRALSAMKRNELLFRYEQSGGRFACPADALPGVIEMLGYRLVTKPIQCPDVLARLEIESMEIVVCQNLPKKLRWPRSAARVRVQCLAHELGHAVNHVGTVAPCEIEDKHEWEADEFAGVFLVPKRELSGTEEIRAIERARRGWIDLDSSDIWRLTLRLASRFRVSGALMRRQLTALEYVDWNSDYREMSVRILEAG